MKRLNRESLRSKILENVTRENDCWIWQKSFGSHGYGNIGTGGQRNETVHRVSYEVFNGTIPEKMLVLHSCDNRKCCNPEHLRVGTYKENLTDRDTRSKRAVVMTMDKAREARASGLSCTELATKYGLSYSSMFKLLRGDTWREV